MALSEQKILIRYNRNPKRRRDSTDANYDRSCGFYVIGDEVFFESDFPGDNTVYTDFGDLVYSPEGGAVERFRRSNSPVDLFQDTAPIELAQEQKLLTRYRCRYARRRDSADADYDRTHGFYVIGDERFFELGFPGGNTVYTEDGHLVYSPEVGYVECFRYTNDPIDLDQEASDIVTTCEPKVAESEC